MKLRYGFFIGVVLIIILYSSFVIAHEPWLLSREQINVLNAKPIPLLFSTLTLSNLTLILSVTAILLIWILLNYFVPEKINFNFSKNTNLALLIMRIGIGSTLILLSLGLLPPKEVAFFNEPSLLAPEFFISKLGITYDWLKFLEFGLGSFFILGIFTRVCSFALLLLLIFCLSMYGANVLQYAGFYLGIILFLTFLGSGAWAVLSTKPIMNSVKSSLLVLQLLTGTNFIYSSISIKLFQPNIDIGILEKYHAFIFGISYPYFAFLMMLSEILLGLCLILGYRLQIIAMILFLLFVFLSINLSENFFSHNFIYGILWTFVLLGGVPFFRKDRIN